MSNDCQEGLNMPIDDKLVANINPGSLPYVSNCPNLKRTTSDYRHCQTVGLLVDLLLVAAQYVNRTLVTKPVTAEELSLEMMRLSNGTLNIAHFLNPISPRKIEAFCVVLPPAHIRRRGVLFHLVQRISYVALYVPFTSSVWVAWLLSAIGVAAVMALRRFSYNNISRRDSFQSSFSRVLSLFGSLDQHRCANHILAWTNTCCKSLSCVWMLITFVGVQYYQNVFMEMFVAKIDYRADFNTRYAMANTIVRDDYEFVMTPHDLDSPKGRFLRHNKRLAAALSKARRMVAKTIPQRAIYSNKHPGSVTDSTSCPTYWLRRYPNLMYTAFSESPMIMKTTFVAKWNKALCKQLCNLAYKLNEYGIYQKLFTEADVGIAVSPNPTNSFHPLRFSSYYGCLLFVKYALVFSIIGFALENIGGKVCSNWGIRDMEPVMAFLRRSNIWVPQPFDAASTVE